MLLIDCDSCIKLDCYYNTVNEVFQVIKNLRNCGDLLAVQELLQRL